MFAFGLVLAVPVIGALVLIFWYEIAVPDVLAILAVSVLFAVATRSVTVRRMIAGFQLVALGPEYERVSADDGPQRIAALARLESQRRRCLQALVAAIAVRITGIGLVALLALYLQISLQQPDFTEQRAWFLAFLWALPARGWHQQVENFPPGWLRFVAALVVGVLLPPPLVLYLITTGCLAIFEAVFHPGMRRQIADYYAIWFRER